MHKVFIILGPTSSGKTSLAFDLCRKTNGEIISADSRQIYKYMDIGTGKTPIDVDMQIQKADCCWIYEGINVWGYDLTTPDKYFSAYDFCNFALPKARELLDLGKSVFLVGGTGFYIDLFTGNVKPANISPNFELRTELEEADLEYLQQELKKLNPDEYEKIDKQNKVRLIRALEKLHANKKEADQLPYLENVEFIYIGLTSERDYIYARFDNWNEKVWESGFIEETQKLLEMGYGDSPKIHGLNYKSALTYINGELTLDQAKERMKFDNHAYIRRQQTYFKKLSTRVKVNWLDISQDNYKETVYNMLNG